MLDDKQIMLEVQNGRFDLFEELVCRYRQPLLRVAASKLADDSRAEDVVQEAFLAVFAARHTYNPAFEFRTWLWTILLNLCRQYSKRASRKPREVVRSAIEAGGTFPEPTHEEGGLGRLLSVERSELLAALLDELPEVQADALRLRFFGGLKYEEIAAAMGSSLGGAKLRVRNGLLALAERMRDHEEDLP